MQNEKQRIRVEFNWFRHILENEEQRELRRLEKEEKAKLDILAQAEAELVQQSQVVTELISDLERRSLWSAVELLQVSMDKKPVVLETQSATVFYLGCSFLGGKNS